MKLPAIFETMKRIAQILFCLTITTHLGCKPVAKLFYGVGSPSFKQDSEIHPFSEELIGKDIPVYMLGYSAWSSGKALSVPEMYVFDKHGNYIPYKDSLHPNCNGPAGLFLTELDTSRNYYTSDELNFDTFLNSLQTTGCMPVSDINKGEEDFYIFFTWVSWMGKKLYKEKTFEWLDELKSNNKIRYKMYSVSLDWADCWSDEQKAFFYTED